MRLFISTLIVKVELINKWIGYTDSRNNGDKEYKSYGDLLWYCGSLNSSSRQNELLKRSANKK